MNTNNTFPMHESKTVISIGGIALNDLQVYLMKRVLHHYYVGLTEALDDTRIDHEFHPAVRTELMHRRHDLFSLVERMDGAIFEVEYVPTLGSYIQLYGNTLPNRDKGTIEFALRYWLKYRDQHTQEYIFAEELRKML